MNGFVYYNPVRIIFGPGELRRLGTETAQYGRRVGVVSYRNNAAVKWILSTVVSLLRAEGLEVYDFYKIEENPDVDTVELGATFCRDNGIDVVVGVGGGSAMDGAKAIAAASLYDGPPWRMVNSRHDHMDSLPPERSLPTLMVPTMPATGSEMNMCAVLSNRAIKEKSYIWAECLFPKVSILDPELTVGLPAFLTACAAVDSISHVLEIYLNGEEDAAQQHYFQEGVMRTVIENVMVALKNPQDMTARSALHWAATCAINGFASPGDAWTPIHQIGHNLTALFGLSHGVSLSVLMLGWMKVMSLRRPEPYLRFALRVMDIRLETEDERVIIAAGIKRFDAFLRKIGVPTRLVDMKIGRDTFDEIVEGVVKVSFGADGYLKCIPPVSREDLYRILEAAFQ